MARTYLYTLNDAPGVVAANNFMSFFNPSTSLVTHFALQLIVSTYSSASTSVHASMLAQRITAASGGTLVAASTIGRFDTTQVDPTTQVRIGNPTVTTTGLVLSANPPVITTGAGGNSSGQAVSAGVSFLLPPGQGLVFYTASGDVDETWNLTYLWQENYN